MYVESCMILVVVNHLSRPIVVLDGLPSLYGFKYDSATVCGLPLYLCSNKLVGSAIVEWGGWTATGACANSPSVVTMKSRFSKRTCMLGTQLTPWLVIRGLMWISRRVKGPYLARQLSVF